MSAVAPWRWRALPLGERTGAEVFEALGYPSQPIATLLESPVPPPQDRPQLARYSICAGPPRTVGGRQQLYRPPLGQVLPCLRRLLRASGTRGIPARCQHLPFVGGWLGWLSYDVAREIERLPDCNPDPLLFPVAYWYEPATFAVLDRPNGTLWLAATQLAELDRLQRCCERTPARTAEPVAPGKPARFVPIATQADYERAVRRAQAYIRAGEIFQANLSLRFTLTTAAASWSVYRALRAINPSPFASYWQTPWGSAIGCSPERLVKLEGRTAQTRPIAGTRARGRDTQTDRELAAGLQGSRKDSAEHLMLLDLARNDLGRVCEWGSVRADERFAIERYSHVMHLVSNVTGRLRSDWDAIDLVRALFPGGTITGCPKVRCMEIIEELEPVRRNWFYGSCGYLDRRGHLDLNIAIRTLLHCRAEGRDPAARYRVWGQVGAGIVADSDPKTEWHESLRKAQAQLAALGLATDRQR